MKARRRDGAPIGDKLNRRLERVDGDYLRAIQASKALAEFYKLGFPEPEIKVICWEAAQIIEKETRAADALHVKQAADSIRAAAAHLRQLHKVRSVSTLNGGYSINELPWFFVRTNSDPDTIANYERDAQNFDFHAQYLLSLVPRRRGHPVGLGERYFIKHMAALCEKRSTDYHDELCRQLLDDIVFYVRGCHEKKSLAAYSRMRHRLLCDPKLTGRKFPSRRN